MGPESSRTRVYGGRRYLHTALVRHQGTTVALAMDEDRRIHYSVLDLNSADGPNVQGSADGSDLDVHHWSEEPRELRFPRELARTGYAVSGVTRIPRVKPGSLVEAGDNEVLADDEVDAFRSSTARLTAAAPFQALSDGTYVYVFRQSVDASHTDALFALKDGGVSHKAGRDDYLTTGKGEAAHRVPLVANGLLCDRFTLGGDRLHPVAEVRYRRSRHRSRPDSAKDTLGAKDMDGNDFHEPTLHLAFAGEVRDGRFTALLLPTSVSELRRWQFFVHNPVARRIESINVEQSEEGLFNTQGSRLYTSPDPKYRDAVLERGPGSCPITQKPLIPVVPDTGFAATALRFDAGSEARVEIPAPAGIPLGSGPYTIEAWVRRTGDGAATLLSAGGRKALVELSFTASGELRLRHAGTSDEAVSAARIFASDTHTHVAVVYDGARATFFVDGARSGEPRKLSPASEDANRLLIGAKPGDDGTPTGFYSGELDEIRLWTRARGAEELAQDRMFRLVGDEPGLAAYYRCDDGSGTTVYDQTTHGLDGTLTGPVGWVTSHAPVADHPGIRKDSFRVPGRTVGEGLTAALYHQQEQAVTGHGSDAKPVKRHARVLLSFATEAADSEDSAEGGDSCLAALDFALSREGRLAQVPDVVELPAVGKAMTPADREEPDKLREEIRRLEGELRQTREARERVERDGENSPELVGDQEYLKRILDNRYSEEERLSDGSDYVIDFGGHQYLTAVKDKQGEDVLVLQSDAEKAGWTLLERMGEWVLAHGPTGRYLAVVQEKLVLREQREGVPENLVFAEAFYLRNASGDLFEHPDGMLRTLQVRGHDSLLEVAAEKGVPILRPVPKTGEGQESKVTFVGFERAGIEQRIRTISGRLTAAQKLKDGNDPFQQPIKEYEGALAARREELGRLTNRLSGHSTPSLPMPFLGQDHRGLGYSGALLTFARGARAPFLTESGAGHLGLYFRDADGRFSSVSYGTDVARSAKELPVTAGSKVLLTARDAGLDLARVTVEVGPDTVGPFEDRCTVTLRRTGTDGTDGTGTEEEVWTLMPRRADHFADILTGVRGNPIVIGKAASLSGGKLALADGGTNQPLTAGSLLKVGDQVYVVPQEAEEGTAQLALSHGSPDATVAQGMEVELVAYDPSLVRIGRPGATAAHGSHWVTAAVIGPSAEVPDGDATSTAQGSPASWWGEVPGRALRFGPGTNPVRLPDTRLDAVRAPGDLTLEAWIRPEGGDARAPIVLANVPQSQYVLALSKPTVKQGGSEVLGSETLGTAVSAVKQLGKQAMGASRDKGAPAQRGIHTGRRPVIGVGDRFVRGVEPVPDAWWTHIAAVFGQSWAVRLEDQASLEVEHADDLDLKGDLTLEVFFRADELGRRQGLVSKGRLASGGEGSVPYQLAIAKDGRPVLAVELADGTVVRAYANAKVTAGRFHRIAVVRTSGREVVEEKGETTVEATGPDGKPTKLTVQAIKSVFTRQYVDVSFTLDGKPAGSTRIAMEAPLGKEAALEIGCGWDRQDPGHFTGEISEVRIWNTGRPANCHGKALGRKESGLVAHWRFEENGGATARDERDAHPAKLRHAKWTKNPDPRGSTFRLYVDGRPVSCEPLIKDEALGDRGYGSRQFTLGSRGTEKDETWGRFVGTMDEVRVWRTARTEEQILDNLFTRLKGEREELLAHYSFDDASTEPDATALIDNGPRGCDLLLPATGRPEPTISSAPVSADTPEVRTVFATGRSAHVQRIDGVPAVTEYSDLQKLPGGDTRGVLKRCYGYLQDGHWHLVTGFKIGDLATEWVGQVQFDPQVIGYIEGAPPVPSENLVATKNPRNLSYINTSSVEFTQADKTVHALSSSRQSSVDMTYAMRLAHEVDVNTLMITAPLGFGIAKPVAEGGASLGVSGNLEFSNAWAGQTDVSRETETARATTVGLSGGWESDDPGAQIDPEGGRRFQPSNTGYALVQSETADVYALRLVHNGALVSYRMQPNPDIPRDWNLLPFAINPRYVKQGTLDGTVGVREKPDPERNLKAGKILDPDYADATGRGEFSYFKPREAYSLKRRLIEEEQRHQAYYESVSTETAAEDPTAAQARKLLEDFTGPARKPAPARRDTAGAARSVARRNIVNTYVWTADGGFFAESTQAADAVTETTTGSYHFAGNAGVSFGTGVKIFGIGADLHLDASLGGSLNRTRSRSKESTRSFALTVKCDPPGDMQKYVVAEGSKGPGKDPDPVYENGKPVEVKGRVNAYRFMTFYLDSDKENFEDLYGKVIDPTWLKGSDPNAAALRQARQSETKPPCWRVLHRVTFVSRQLPGVLPDDAPALDKAMVVEKVSSSYELIRRLDPFVKPHLHDHRSMAQAVRDAIKDQLPELTPHENDVIDFFARYYDIQP
ncbi:LamG domain-containing protein [Streptomyces sp. UNOB3_S3]|uniref:LamG domain-containing protein n=1 Tax=Streptomyces sp. UNOB3_S3 TaxID=2871682 RepID=UPI001E39CB99|nr:LamG domain-containing protein [Streptomyces sp. UNOB3_S3]MCC3773289.1 LamG domain-containing protein [Streptomyces sp. UNOB3_S3]